MYRPTVPPEHVLLVAFQVGATTRSQAQLLLMRQLPELSPDFAEGGIYAWWIAEDDRIDGSDCDSAIFVTPGLQKLGSELLVARDLSPPHNLVDRHPNRFTLRPPSQH